MEEVNVPRVVSNNNIRMTPEDALEAGLRIGNIYKQVGVAMDSDPATTPIFYALVAGLNAAGADVVSVGICPTVAACLTLRNRCKVIITVGSPDVSSMTCLTFYRPDGTVFNSVDERVLETKVPKEDLPEWDGVGGFTEIANSDKAYEEYITKSGMKISGYIIMDCGCGCTADIAPHALSGMGGDVSSLDSDYRRRKPRNPGLNKSELLYLSNFVDASTGSIGIAYNGDGTALAVMDENGKTIPPERLLALMLMYIEPRCAVVPFNSSAIVENAFENGLHLRPDAHSTDHEIYRGTGVDDILEIAKEKDADFVALEGGKFVFPEMSFCPDAVYASAIIAELSGKRSLRNLLEDLPNYISKEIRIPFTGNLRRFDEQLKKVTSRYDIKELVSDGGAWKVLMKHGQFAIVYAEGELVITAESTDQTYLVTMGELAQEIVRACL